jgi:hypothetical protein
MAEYDENIGVLLAHICKAQRNLAEAEFNKLGLRGGQGLTAAPPASMGGSGCADAGRHVGAA